MNSNQVIYIKQTKRNGEAVADRMHTKLAEKIDRKNNRRAKRR